MDDEDNNKGLGGATATPQPALASRAQGLGPSGFDQAQFLEFCRRKPVDEEYCSSEPDICALAQFGFTGVNGINCDAQYGIPYDVYCAAVHDAPYEFGALTDRLTKLGAK